MTELWDEWFANQDRWNGDHWYRGVYAAYFLALRPATEDDGEARMQSTEDGGFLLYTNNNRPPLEFADAGEAGEFAEWLEKRCCRDKYPDMNAWEAQQHQWFKDDLNDWTMG